jgi:hypothetical protein
MIFSKCTTSSSACDLCKENFFYVSESKTCESSCGSGFYPDTENRKCTACSIPNCDKCLGGLATCSACKTGFLFIIDTQRCVSECPPKYIKIGSDCRNCETGCETCTSTIPGSCNKCYSPWVFRVGQCASDCSSGEYRNGDICELCSSSYCAECPSNKCQKCNFGYYLYPDLTCGNPCSEGYFTQSSPISACLSCYISNCGSCSSLDTCQICKTPSVLYKSSCVAKCPVQTVLNGEKCLDCPKDCQECSLSDKSIVTCIKCKTNYLAHANQCLLSCPDYFYSFLIEGVGTCLG